mgnify:CR=1 FL=1
MAKTSPILNIPNKSSEGSAWIQWHKVLKSNFGKKEANALFLKAWRMQGDTYKANTNELREYLGKNGIDIEKNILSSIYDTGDDILDSIGGLLNIGKYAAIAVGVIVIGGLAMAVYNIAKNPIGAAGAARKFTPAGAAASAVGGK